VDSTAFIGLKGEKVLGVVSGMVSKLNADKKILLEKEQGRYEATEYL
jgi:hypothetical protein